MQLPQWMTLTKDTIRGTPRNENVGSDTIRLSVKDRSGLSASLLAVVRVINENESPFLKRVELPHRSIEDSMVIVKVIAGDADVGDSLRLSWQKRPAWLSVTAATHAIDSGEWRFALSGTPMSGDTGLNWFSFKILDRSETAVAVAESLYVVDRPNTRIVKKQAAFGAVRYLLGAGSAADSGLRFEVTLLSIADAHAIETTAGPSGNVEFFPLSDGQYLFSAVAVNGGGIADAHLLTDTLLISGATVHTFTGDSVAWNMIGVPARTIAADSVRGGGSLVTWDESGIERDIYGYYVPSKEIREVTAGRAYWRRSRDSKTVAIDRSKVVDSAAAITLSRSRYGWNQVASPFAYPVRWPKATSLWKWSGDDYELCNDLLEPWQGYWVMAESSEVVTLEPKPVFSDSGRMAKRAAAWYVGKNEWRYRLTLEGKNVVDRENAFGISRKASDGFDASDLFEPPRMNGAGYLFFPHPEWKKTATEFASDIRKAVEPVALFQVGIASWEGNDSAIVRIEGYDPRDGQFIFIKDAAGVREYNHEQGLALPPSGQTRYLTLFVTSDRSLARMLPVSFVCGNPYPNPCRSGTRIRYTLPYQWRKDGLLTADEYIVKIAVYDLAGRKLRDLVHRKQQVGAYTVLWDGKMNTGRMVGAGSYVLMLHAGDISAMKSIIVLR
jgi:hypothetical protein